MYIEFNLPKRCQCKNKNNRVCSKKQKKLYIYKNKHICSFHYIYNNNNDAILIQSYYRGYKQRKLLKNIYKKLPDDIQYKIINLVREEYNYKKYLKNIEKVLIKKMEDFSSNIFNAYDNDKFIPFSYFEYVLKNRNFIENIYRCYSKYSKILSKSFIKHSHNLSDNLILMNYKLVEYKYRIYNAYTNDIYEVTSATFNQIEHILFDGGFISEF